jgi:hypothetical protein
LVYRSIMVSPECCSSHQSDRINTFCSGNRDFFLTSSGDIPSQKHIYHKSFNKFGNYISIYSKSSTPLNAPEIEFDGRMHPLFTPISRSCYAPWCCRRLLVAMLPSPPLQKSQFADHIPPALRTGFKCDGWYPS